MSRGNRDRDLGVPANVQATDDSFIPALATVLTHLVSLAPSNDNAPGRITRFHGVISPTISVREYLNRIAKYFRCSNECFVLSLVYIDRIVKLHEGFAVSILNIHRLLITAVMLAAKFFDDVYFSNAFYARVGGVGTKEMNLLEAHFLSLINYQLFVSPEEYDQYRQNVQAAVKTTSNPAGAQSAPAANPSSSSAHKTESSSGGQAKHSNSTSSSGHHHHSRESKVDTDSHKHSSSSHKTAEKHSSGTSSKKEKEEKAAPTKTSTSHSKSTKKRSTTRTGSPKSGEKGLSDGYPSGASNAKSSNALVDAHHA